MFKIGFKEKAFIVFFVAIMLISLIAFFIMLARGLISWEHGLDIFNIYIGFVMAFFALAAFGVSIETLKESRKIADEQNKIAEQEWQPQLSYEGMRVREHIHILQDQDTGEEVEKKVSSVSLFYTLRNVGRCTLQYKSTGFEITQIRRGENNEVIGSAQIPFNDVSGFILTGSASTYSTEKFAVTRNKLSDCSHFGSYGSEFISISNEFRCKFRVEYWKLNDSDSKFYFDVEGSLYMDYHGNLQDSTSVTNVIES